MTSSISHLGKPSADDNRGWQVLVYCPGNQPTHAPLRNRKHHQVKKSDGTDEEFYDVIPWHSERRPTRKEFRSWDTRCPDCGLRWWKYMDPIEVFDEEEDELGGVFSSTVATSASGFSAPRQERMQPHAPSV